MPKYSLFSSKADSSKADSSKQAALFIYGECFMDGSVYWNEKQAASIAKDCGIEVYTLGFSKYSYADSLRVINAYFQELDKKHPKKVGLIGCSSCGFLALNVLKEASMPLPQFVVLLCPVLNPELREPLLLEAGVKHAPTIQAKQSMYFKTKPYPSPFSTTRTPITIIAAKDDENVPFSLIQEEAAKYRDASLHCLEGTHKLCFKPSAEVNELLHAIVHSTAGISCHL
jgi:acetyl esterase/lipase